MSTRQLIVLGTSSQVPTRYRSHNSYVLRWDDQLILFDPGEGAQRQCTLAGVSVAKLTAVCITHFHGDHCLGLPGIIQRRALDNRNSEQPKSVPLPVYFAADGEKYFDRMRSASIFNDTSNVVPKPITQGGEIGTLGKHKLIAAELKHRTTTFGYRIQEPESVRLNKQALTDRSIEGPAVGQLVAQGSVQTSSGIVKVEEVSRKQPGQAMAFVMDTSPCDNAVSLARNVDLLVCESTFLETERDLATKYFHMTAKQAAELAQKAEARRLVLSHYSSRYPNTGPFYEEAAPIHHDVVAAEDLLVVEVPARTLNVE